MKIELESPRLIQLESKCISAIHQLNINEIDKAKEMLLELREMIEEQRNLINHQWKDALFCLANKL